MFTNNYAVSRQVTYRGMIWLLAAQLVVMLPFAFNLPIWLLPVMLAATYWRIRVIKGHSAQPKLATQLLIIAMGVIGILVSGMSLLSLDSMVSFLLLGFAFKSLEVIRQRDALVVIFIGYFLVAISFLFSQSILAGAYGVMSLIVLTSALIANQQSPAQQLSQHANRTNLRLATLMLLQCLPLMALVFVFMPRFSPLWVIPSFENQARSGISDRMAPGDIANLSKSDELAFRVSFSGRKPTADEMYWRGLVLNHFDGVNWQQLVQDYEPIDVKNELLFQQPWNLANVAKRGEPIHYEAIYEKTGRPWLFTLTPTTQVSHGVVPLGDYRVMSHSPLQSPFLLQASSYPESQRDLTLTQYTRSMSLQLPLSGNPQARQRAIQWRRDAGSDTAYVQKILDRFNQQSYFYTLSPPLLGDKDNIDAFLFESQRGFCSHYAGSFVFLMRAAGIPARIVVGYLGGKWNDSGEYLSVHQYDAHAWTEVWIAGTGWMRVDPTASVAPSRIEGGLEAALEHEGSFPQAGFFSTKNYPWLEAMRQQLDAVQYGWQRWILGYDGNSQANLLKHLLDKLSSIPLFALVGTLFLGIFLLWFITLGFVYKRNHEAYEHRLYRQFCKRLAKLGVTRNLQHTPTEFAIIASEQLPSLANTIQAFSLCYQTLCYEPHAHLKRDSQISMMKRLLKQIN